MCEVAETFEAKCACGQCGFLGLVTGDGLAGEADGVIREIGVAYSAVGWDCIPSLRALDTDTGESSIELLVQVMISKPNGWERAGKDKQAKNHQ